MCHTYKLILSSLIPVTSIDSFLSQSMCFNKNNPSSPHLLQPPMMTSDIQLSWSLQLQSPFSRPLCFPRSPRGEHQGLRGGSDSVASRVTGTAWSVSLGPGILGGRTQDAGHRVRVRAGSEAPPVRERWAQSKAPGTRRGCRALLPRSSAPYTQLLHTCPHGIAQPLTGTHLPRSIVTKSDLPLCDVSKSNATTLNTIHSLS